MNIHQPHQKSSITALTLAAIGVVYGDIGTSPIYAIKEIFAPNHGVGFSYDNMLGIVSLIIWTLIFVVGFKYVALILRADNNGEGGNMAMLALALNALGRDSKIYPIVIIFGLVGAALFYGDGVITPAISVLGAVEGLSIVTPVFNKYVIPIVVVIITALYAVQKKGTGSIGRLFGPITLLWFLTLAVMGVYNIIIGDTSILLALNPIHAFQFVVRNGFMAFVVLGSVTLAVTGAEALYADMGHFGRTPIRLAWYLVVFPSLTLCYLGQGALLLSNPLALKSPFFLMIPSWGTLPLVILATMAAVIASQATISGCFSLTKQAVQLGFLPRMKILHTSVKEAGQIYIPFINWVQYVLVIAVVISFGSSSALASAYGIAVTGCMLVVTLMTFFVIRYQWKLPLWICLLSTGLFVFIDFIFLGANLLKFKDGGWFPIALGAAIFLFMYTWHRGRVAIRNSSEEQMLSLTGFLSSIFIAPPAQVEGTAVYLNAKSGIVPRALMHNLLHNKVIHERNIFLTVRTLELPWVDLNQHLKVEDLGNNCFAIEVNYGFKNQLNIPDSLALCTQHGLIFNEMETSYFLSRYTLLSDTCTSLPMWMEKIFAIMLRNASDPAEYLGLPTNRVIELGAQIRI
jgi:KUP system potassium uptake protein